MVRSLGNKDAQPRDAEWYHKGKQGCIGDKVYISVLLLWVLRENVLLIPLRFFLILAETLAMLVSSSSWAGLSLHILRDT